MIFSLRSIKGRLKGFSDIVNQLIELGYNWEMLEDLYSTEKAHRMGIRGNDLLLIAKYEYEQTMKKFISLKSGTVEGSLYRGGRGGIVDP